MRPNKHIRVLVESRLCTFKIGYQESHTMKYIPTKKSVNGFKALLHLSGIEEKQKDNVIFLLYGDSIEYRRIHIGYIGTNHPRIPEDVIRLESICQYVSQIFNSDRIPDMILSNNHQTNIQICNSFIHLIIPKVSEYANRLLNNNVVYHNQNIVDNSFKIPGFEICSNSNRIQITGFSTVTKRIGDIDYRGVKEDLLDYCLKGNYLWSYSPTLALLCGDAMRNVVSQAYM